MRPVPAQKDPGPAAPDTVRRLYLVRHGEAAPIAREGVAADPWQASLTMRGKAQITELADAMVGCRLDLIVTSAVPRAIETAALLAGRIGLRPAVEADWNELRSGAVLAGSAGEIRRSIRASFREAGQPGARFLGGESFVGFAERVERALDRMLALPGWARAAVVTHEPAIGCVLARCHGLDLGDLDRFELSPGSASILDWPSGAIGIERATVRLINGVVLDVRRLG